MASATDGCQRDAPTVQADLLEIFPYTEEGTCTDSIDLGTPDSEPYVGRGWSAAEHLPSGESVAYADGREARLHFGIGQPSPRQIVLRCGVVAGFRRPVRATLQMNGRTLGPLVLHEGLEEHSYELPAQLQRSGENVLSIQQRRVPRRRPGPQPRREALACDWIRIQQTSGRVAPRPRLLRRDRAAIAIEIPAMAAATYFLRLPRDAVLDADVEPDDNAGVSAKINVWVERDGTSAELVAATGAGAKLHADLGRFAGDIVRLRLRAEGTGKLRLQRVRISGARKAAVSRLVGTTSRRRPNVVLYIVDTVRADHLGVYGYPLATSPSIDAFAADAMTFTRAMAQASWTRPATASILTGVYPFTHGAISLHDGIRPGVSTMAEQFKSAGYRSAAFVTNINVGGGFGFNRGFDEFTYLPEDEKRPELHVRADAVNEAAFPWLAAHAGEPFLLYLHVSDPHAPYLPPDGFDEKFRPGGLASPLAGADQPVRKLQEQPALVTPDNLRFVQSLYDGEIAYVDRCFGSLIAELKRLGLYDSTVVVLVADHGEEFNDHGGFEHGYTLYGEQLAIPLLIRLPDIPHRAGKVTCPARQIDVLPTLLQAAGLRLPPQLEGRPLLAIDDGDCPTEESFAQTSLSERSERRADVFGDWKVIESPDARGGSPQLFDLRRDPGERADVATQHPVLMGYGLQALRQWVAQRPPAAASTAPVPTLSAETVERLRALGYAP